MDDASKHLIIIGLIILGLAGMLLMDSYITTTNANKTTISNGNYSSPASLYLKLSAPALDVENFKLTVSGKGILYTTNVSFGPKLYSESKMPIDGIVSISAPINVTSKTDLNGTVLVPENSTTMVFTGLEPTSSYKITISGSESPYCFPTLACPLFIIKLSNTYLFSTGPSDSAINLSINVIPQPTPASNATSSCTGFPIIASNYSYIKCYDNSRLLNSVLLHVNYNNTITADVYPYYQMLTNVTITPKSEVFSKGETVGFECSGYYAVLSATNYTQQYVIFKVVKTRPLPCPARV